MNVVTLRHNYWHTGSRHVKFYGGDRPCCLCRETKEDWRHILKCPSLDASYHQDASWQKVKKDMQMWRLPAYFWTALEKGLHHLPRDLKESTSPTLPFQITQPNQESPTGSLSGTKLNQMDKPTQGTHVPQMAAIRHRTRPFKKTRPTRTIMGPQIHHCIMGPFTSNMALPQ
jgi:hypothetical protein